MSNLKWIKVQPRSVQPGTRWGHSCCVVGHTLYLFGGFANSNYMNDLWLYNLKTLTWNQVATFGDIPEQRSNATISYDSVNHQLILFGGGGHNKQRFNSISTLDLNTFSWVEFHPFQNEPAPWERTYHTAEFKYPYLFVFGGESINDLGDLWTYNIQTLSWNQINFQNQIAPQARRFHSSCMTQDSLYIMGGCGGKYSCLNDLFRLDLSKFMVSGNSIDLRWQQIKLKGDNTVARWGQTSHYFEGQIYIFGGRETQDLQDILAIDVKTGQVRQIEASSPPCARRRHSGGFIGSCLIVFGGFDGNYFNDLYYINLYKNNHTKNHANKRQVSQIIDHEIKTVEKQLFRLNTTRIGRYFSIEEDMIEFLEEIQGYYLYEELQTIFQTLYRGYGKLKLQKNHQYFLSFLPPQQKPSDKELISQYVKISHLNQLSIDDNSSVIQLELSQLREYIKSTQQHWQYHDHIQINKKELIKVNRRLLCTESPFFQIFFSKHYKKNERYSINLSFCQTLHFEIILAFLHTKILVVPKIYSHRLFVELAQIAQYFCISSLQTQCQRILAQRVDLTNYKELSGVGSQFGFGCLLEQCSYVELNDIFAKQERIDALLSQEQEQLLEQKTRQLYNLIRFDLAHQKDNLKYSKIKILNTEKNNKDTNKQNMQVEYTSSTADNLWYNFKSSRK